MSTNLESDNDTMMLCCVACGITGADDIKLKKCTACKSVRYCSVDVLLFKQPESRNLGECPICFLQLSIERNESTLMACCCKVICGGCHYANLTREAQGSLDSTCAFCRQPRPKSKEDFDMCLMRRIEVNDPFALCQMGANRRNEGDYDGAFEYWAKAAALGDAAAHCGLSDMYRNGEGFEKDEKKALHHLEEAAIGGNPFARNNLGVLEERKGRIDRAVKHWIIAAKLGDDLSLESIKGCFTAGLISKDVFAEALRACQAAIDETKSPQREAAVQKLNAAGIAR